MQKVIVIDCSGSGKSTFSKALHNLTGPPLYYLDMMKWNADGTNVPKSTFMERLYQVLKKKSWIIDGNYQDGFEENGLPPMSDTGLGESILQYFAQKRISLE